MPEVQTFVVVLASGVAFINVGILALFWIQWKTIPVNMGILAGIRRMEKHWDELRFDGDELSKAHVQAITRVPVKERRPYLA